MPLLGRSPKRRPSALILIRYVRPRAPVNDPVNGLPTHAVACGEMVHGRNSRLVLTPDGSNLPIVQYMTRVIHAPSLVVH